MSQSVSLFSFTAAGLTAFTLVAAVFVSSDFAAADETTQSAPSCSCPDNGNKPSRRPKLAALSTLLDETDEVAALESLQFALTEVADGSSYVWHRNNGRLSGIVKPIGSFKNKTGSVCRTIVVVLSSSTETKKTETVACRLPTGVWELEG